MIVKLTTCVPDRSGLVQTPQCDGRWGDIEFRVNDDCDECDWWFVGDDPVGPFSAKCPPGHLVLITWEPPTCKTYPQRYTRQFDHVITCNPATPHPNLTITQLGYTWHIKGVTYTELQKPMGTKSRKMSLISSNKSFLPGHVARLEFVDRVRQAFGDRIDFFGRGTNELENKYDGLAPYKYSIAIENEVLPHYWTEKISDCFLTETVPVYYGSPNISDYFPARSYIEIDIQKPDAALQIIGDLLESDDYESRRPALAQAKTLVLDQYQLFPMIAGFIASQGNRPPGQRQNRSIRTIGASIRWDPKRLASRAKEKLSNRILGLVKR